MRCDVAVSPGETRHLLDCYSSPVFESWLRNQGQPKYRAGQLRQWLFGRRATELAQMTDLPQKLRAELAEQWRLWTTQVVTHRRSTDGTEKLLLGLEDGQRIECVLIREGQRRTICISTQVGCAMGCVFCASGLDGVVRNLTTGEIVEQMLRLQQLLADDERLSHIVVMGMGEPLANLERLLPALGEATAKDGAGISPRRITISTVGLPAGLRRLAESGEPYHLAVSLHAANDALRTELVPVNRNIGLQEILAGVDDYFDRTGRRPTFEYVLLADVNDRPQDAEQLVRLLRGRTALVNVIPFNTVEGLPYRTPSRESLDRFLEILRRGRINVQVRRRKGSEIDAACGQLRRQIANREPHGQNERALTFGNR